MITIITNTGVFSSFFSYEVFINGNRELILEMKGMEHTIVLADKEHSQSVLKKFQYQIKENKSIIDVTYNN